MLQKEFKDIVRDFGPNGYTDFLEYYELSENKERLFEVISCFALEELYPSAKVYDLNFPSRIPATVIRQHNLDHILQGQGTRGGDILVVDTHFSILFDCKTKKNLKKSIGRDSVSGKYTAWKGLNKGAVNKGVRGIEKFGIISDTLADLTINTKKDMPEASLLNRDDILNQEIYKSIYNKCINEDVINGDPVDFRPNKPWTDTAKEYVKALGKLVNVENFVELSIMKLKADVQQYHKDHPDALLKIINLWPAGAGKTTFWILCWIHIFFDKSAKNVFNMVVCHNTTVMNNNIMRFVHHVHTMAPKEQPEIIVVSDKKMSGNSDTEDYLIKNYTKQMTFGIDFVKYLRQKRNHQVFIFTLIHNYTKLENVLAEENITVNYTFLDELHHYIQPVVVDPDTGHILENWGAPVENKRGVLKNILGASANKKEIEDLTGFTLNGVKAVDMEVGPLNTWQIGVTHISEIMARDFGWKRQAVLKIKPFAAECFKNKKLVEKLNEGKNPKVKLKGFSKPVPVYWLTNADAWLTWKLENPGKYHTLATCNSLKNCMLYAEFLQFYIDQMLMEYVKEMKGINGNSEIVKRIKNIHIEVVETENYNTAQYLRKVEAVPLQQGGEFEDSVILHCKLLGEGWSPKGGWVDSTQFIDPAHSKMKIYQFLERAARVTEDAQSEANHVIFAHWDNTDNNVHNLFKFVKTVCEELEIAVDPIGETEVFEVIGSTISAGGGVKKKSSTIFFVEDADVLQSNFKLFYRDGKYVPNYNIYVEYLNELALMLTQYADDEYAMFSAKDPFAKLSIDKIIREKIYKKHKDSFTNKDCADNVFRKVKRGEFVSSLLPKALEIDDIVETAITDLTNQNKPLLEQAVQSVNQLMVTNILDYASPNEDTIITSYNRLVWDTMQQVAPISCRLTKQLKASYDKYELRILNIRAGWYGVDLTIDPAVLAESDKTVTDVLAVLKSVMDKLFCTESNFIDWKTPLAKKYNRTNVELTKIVERLTLKKGAMQFLDKQKIDKNASDLKNIFIDSAKNCESLEEWKTKFFKNAKNRIPLRSHNDKFFEALYKKYKYLNFTDVEIDSINEIRDKLVHTNLCKTAQKRVNAPGFVSSFVEYNKKNPSGRFKDKGIPVQIADVLNGVKVNKKFANKHRAAEYLASIGYITRMKKPMGAAGVEVRCKKSSYPGWTLLYNERTDNK